LEQKLRKRTLRMISVSESVRVSIDTLLVSIDTGFTFEKSMTLLSLEKRRFAPEDFPICIISPLTFHKAYI